MCSLEMFTLTHPPLTTVEPVTDVIHGTSVVDPYRWLEEQDSPRTRQWIRQQQSYAREYLDSLPYREYIEGAVRELLARTSISTAWNIGDRYFYLKRFAEAEQSCIVTRTAGSDIETILVDPQAFSSGKPVALKILDISPDASLLAYGIITRADFTMEVGFLDVLRNRVLGDRLSRGLNCQICLSPDHRGFHFSHECCSSDCGHHLGVYWRDFGASPSEDRRIFEAENVPNTHLRMFASADRKVMGYLIQHSGDSITLDLYVQHVHRGKEARKLLEQITPIFRPFFAGHRIYALTDFRAPNLRVISIDPGRPKQENWQDVIPESIDRIRDLTCIGSFLCVVYVHKLSNQIRVFCSDGRQHSVIPTPGQGTILLLSRPPSKNELLYEFSSFTQPTTVFS